MYIPPLMFTSSLSSPKSITFQGRHTTGDKKSQNNLQDRQQAQKELDDAFLADRGSWFQTNRPTESREDGYVTTPYHSDDEGRFSARKYARNSDREFDSSTQKFRKRAASDNPLRPKQR